MKRLLLALSLPLLLSIPCASAQDEETPAIQRYLAHLYLGDAMDDIQRIYPPAQEWVSSITPRGRVSRYRVDRYMAKAFPTKAETLYLGMKRDRLVEIQVVYSEKFSRSKSADELAGDMALTYGTPQRNDSKYWWTDGKTVLRVFNQEIPVLKDGVQAVELRTSIQILEHGLFERVD